MSPIEFQYNESPQQLEAFSGPFSDSSSISPDAEEGITSNSSGFVSSLNANERETTNMRKRRRQVGLKRSRTGCLQCRQRRKKCRLEKPVCKSCEDRKWTCVYPTPSTEQQSPVAPPSQTTAREASSKSSSKKIVQYSTPAAQRLSPNSAVLQFSNVLSEDGTPESSIFDDNFIQEETTPNTTLMSVSALSTVVRNSISSLTNGASATAMPSSGTFNPPMDNLDGLDPLSLLNYSVAQKELVYHFTVAISSVISYYRQEGPFRRLILSLLVPVSRPGTTLPSSTGPLLSSLCALASAHKSYALGLAPDESQLSFHTAALENLITLLEDLPTRLEDENTQNVLLASILILVYYEIAKGGNIESISMHLNGAYRIITSFLNHVIYRLQTSNTTGSAKYRVSNETIFLFRIFQYFDVICSLSKRGKLLDRSLQLHHFLSTYSRLKQSTASSVKSGDQNEQGIDPVIGLAEDLWPLIMNLCILCNDCDFGQSASPDILSRASLLELELSSWEVPKANSQPGTPLPRDLAMQSAAKVYQLAAQVYLLRTFFPAEHVADRIQTHVRSALDHLARVCTLEGNMAALLWPVSVIASECVDSIDRGFVKVVFQKLGKRQGMGNVMRGLQAVESGWRGLTEAEVVMFG